MDFHDFGVWVPKGLKERPAAPEVVGRVFAVICVCVLCGCVCCVCVCSVFLCFCVCAFVFALSLFCV